MNDLVFVPGPGPVSKAIPTSLFSDPRITGLKKLAQLVVFALTLEADEGGEGGPDALERVTQDCQITRHELLSMLGELERRSVVTVTSGPGGFSLYQLCAWLSGHDGDTI